jgi:hypothetical protein
VKSYAPAASQRWRRSWRRPGGRMTLPPATEPAPVPVQPPPALERRPALDLAAAPPPRSGRCRRRGRLARAVQTCPRRPARRRSLRLTRCDARPTRCHPPRLCLARLPACCASELEHGACCGWQTRMCARRGDERTEVSQTPKLGGVGVGASAAPGGRAEAGHCSSRSRVYHGSQQRSEHHGGRGCFVEVLVEAQTRRELGRRQLLMRRQPPGRALWWSAARRLSLASTVVGVDCPRHAGSTQHRASACWAAASSRSGGRGRRDARSVGPVPGSPSLNWDVCVRLRELAMHGDVRVLCSCATCLGRLSGVGLVTAEQAALLRGGVWKPIPAHPAPNYTPSLGHYHARRAYHAARRPDRRSAAAASLSILQLRLAARVDRDSQLPAPPADT